MLAWPPCRAILARLCSDPVLFLRAENGPWWRAESTLWSCAAQPRDWRIGALVLAGVALMALVSHAPTWLLGSAISHAVWPRAAAPAKPPIWL